MLEAAKKHLPSAAVSRCCKRSALIIITHANELRRLPGVKVYANSTDIRRLVRRLNECRLTPAPAEFKALFVEKCRIRFDYKKIS